MLADNGERLTELALDARGGGEHQADNVRFDIGFFFIGDGRVGVGVRGG